MLIVRGDKAQKFIKVIHRKTYTHVFPEPNILIGFPAVRSGPVWSVET